MRTTLATARWTAVAVLALGIAGPPKSAHADDQQTPATIAALKRMGATVQTDTTPDGLIRVSRVAFFRKALTNADLVHLESLKDLSSLRIYASEMGVTGRPLRRRRAMGSHRVAPDEGTVGLFRFGSDTCGTSSNLR
jgi:hypothetical protein